MISPTMLFRLKGTHIDIFGIFLSLFLSSLLFDHWQKGRSHMYMYMFAIFIEIVVFYHLVADIKHCSCKSGSWAGEILISCYKHDHYEWTLCFWSLFPVRSIKQTKNAPQIIISHYRSNEVVKKTCLIEFVRLNLIG